MKTSDSIEQQPERKAARDSGVSLRDNTEPVTQKRRRGDASYKARIAPFECQKGFCPNPGGRPKHDLSAEIAKAWLEIQQAASKQWPTENLSRAEVVRRYTLLGIQFPKYVSPRDIARATERLQASQIAYTDERLRH